MKYFICTLETTRSENFGNCLLAIPHEYTERIISTGSVDAVLEGNLRDFISIPNLLNLKDKSTKHELILKSKTALLLPKIDVELEISEEEIQQLPKVLGEMFNYFRGVYFNSDMILILDPEKLLEH